MDYEHLLLLFGVGALAGFINIMAGGGSIITLPVLLFLGLDGASANGTNRVAICVQNIFAVFSFRQQKQHQFVRSFKLALWTLPGAVIGALLAVNISDVLFEKILVVVMIGVVGSMFFSPVKNNNNNSSPKKNEFLIYPAMFGLGFYGGFIQVGIGFLLMAALYHILNLNLIFVNMHKVFIVMIYTIPALFIFVWTGNVNWQLGLSLAAGNALGGWCGAKYAVKGGEKLIRIILAVAVVIMSLKLLNVF